MTTSHREADRQRLARIRELREELAKLETDDERHEEAERVLRADYWAHVRSLAAEAEDQIRQALKDGADEPDVGDIVHDLVDGSSWVIYTRQNFEVLRWSQNRDVYTDEMGRAPTDRSGAIDWAALAYMALGTDVAELVDEDGVREEFEAARAEAEGGEE